MTDPRPMPGDDGAMPEKYFTGRRVNPWVNSVQMVDAKGIRPLLLRLDPAAKSSTGFDWGHSGVGPARLALAICAAVMNEADAQAHHQDVKAMLIAPIQSDRWTLTADQVLSVVQAVRAARAAAKRRPRKTDR